MFVMGSAITISVIIPVYNKIKYLPQLLQDMCAQSFRDYECLLIDDGSTDGSDTICDEFAARDGRFRVFHIPNCGVSHARNYGLDRAYGEYITFVDSDDRLHREYLENLYEAIAKSKADMAISSVAKVFENVDQQITMPVPFLGVVRMADALPTFAQVQQESGLYGCCVAKIFRHDAALNIRFDENLHLAEDFDYYLRLYPRMKSICFDSKAYYYYLQEAENSSVQVRSELIDYVAQLQINLRYRDFLKRMDHYSGDNQLIVNRLINNYIYYSLFYCPQKQFKKRFQLLQKICMEQGHKPLGEGLLQSWMLLWLRLGICPVAKYTMCGYHTLRKWVR